MIRTKEQIEREAKLCSDTFYLIGSQWALMADMINLTRLEPEEARAIELSGQIWLQIKSQAETVEYIKENFARAYGEQVGQALTNHSTRTSQPKEKNDGPS